MLSFKQHLTKDQFILELAEQFFTNKIEEASDDTLNYYERPPQFITMSLHALKDGMARGRLWWDNDNRLKDPRFTEFANKCLDRIKTAPEQDSLGIPLPKEVRGEIGFCDLKEQRGWVTSLRESKDGNLTSFNIVTVLYMPKMNQNVALFAKRDTTYVINIDKKAKETVSKEDSLKAEYQEIDDKIKEINSKYEDAYLEYEYEEDEKVKRLKKKEVDKLEAQLTQLKNRKEKLKATFKESITITDTSTNKTLTLYFI